MTAAVRLVVLPLSAGLVVADTGNAAAFDDVRALALWNEVVAAPISPVEDSLVCTSLAPAQRKGRACC